jgi:hypothetical protein
VSVKTGSYCCANITRGYIDWDAYDRNRRLIADNAQMKGVMVKGAPREGRSLLAGLLRCRRCGRKLHVAYSGVGLKVPRYACQDASINYGTGKRILFGGLRVDVAVESEVLRVLTAWRSWVTSYFS